MATAYKLAKIIPQRNTLDFLYQYGDFSLAYHTLQPELSHFMTDYGYIAYIEFQNETIVLGDPVADTSDYNQILSEFLEFRPKCSFIQAGSITADILALYSFSVDCFGVESQIALPYATNGKHKREVRNLSNSAIRNKITVKEIHDRNLLFKNSVQQQNKFEILYPFKSTKEYSFLSRPLSNKNENGVRFFGGSLNGKLICYSMFDPIYKNEKIIGYAESIARQTTQAIKGARTFTLIEAMKQFSKEKIKYVNIGLLPFFRENTELTYHQYSDKKVAKIFSMLYKSSPLVSNFKGLSFHKSRYRGSYIPKYFVSNSNHKYKTLLSIYQLTTGRKIPFI